ncbi:hypothetical protein [Nocardioides nanhaiensis]|uniref:Uncharacterized protein n=1 Tax=Nocardioides nanhaiensis TaxID=1476871 RepID=A0ABP8WHE6_9ACTN
MARRGKHRRGVAPTRRPGVPGLRAVSLLVLVLALVTVPAAALARFTTAKTASQVVGTAEMVAPSQVTGTASCANNLGSRSLTVTVNGFAVTPLAGESYLYELLRADTVVARQQTTSRSATLNGSASAFLNNVTWTVRITAVRGSWSSDPWTKSVTCTLGGGGGGPL